MLTDDESSNESNFFETDPAAARKSRRLCAEARERKRAERALNEHPYIGDNYGKRGYTSFRAGACEDEMADSVAAREWRCLCAAARDRRRAELALEDQYMGFDTGKRDSKPFGSLQRTPHSALHYTQTHKHTLHTQHNKHMRRDTGLTDRSSRASTPML